MLFALASCRSATQAGADLVLVNGKVFTADDSRPWAQAIAIRGDRIAAVGDDGTIRALTSSATRIVDLEGRVVVPGINDAHVHQPWSVTGEDIDVPETASFDELFERIRAATKQYAPGTWLRIGLPNALIDDVRISRDSLDSAAPQHPVQLSNFGGHVYVLNSLALRDWNIGDNDADPQGGRYGRANGKINGWLYEHAAWVNQRTATDRASDDAIVAKMRAFANEAVGFGVTSVQTMPSGSVDRLARLASQTGVPLRWRWMDMHRGVVDEHPAHPAKYILDGTPIERDAAMREPYSDRSEWRGQFNYSAAQIGRMIEVAATTDQQLLLHIAGDAPFETVLAPMRTVPANWPSKRVRIEHGDFVSSYLDEIQRLGIIIVQNPAHFTIRDLVLLRYGPQRVRDFQMLRTLIARGIHVAIGSDGPPNPWLNVMLATVHPVDPAEAITREQAVIAYTRGSAYAEFTEHEKGTIAAGKLADLAVLSQDIFTVPTEQLPATHSVMTLIGGKVVFNAPEFAASR